MGCPFKEGDKVCKKVGNVIQAGTVRNIIGANFLIDLQGLGPVTVPWKGWVKHQVTVRQKTAKCVCPPGDDPNKGART